MWGERQHMTNKVLCIEIPNANSVRKTYQTSSSLCCFTLLPAEPDASFASLQRWLGWVKHNVKTETVPHQSYTEGPKSQRLGVYHWMHVYTYSFLGFCEYFNSHFPQFWGIFFFFPYMQNDCTCMHKAAECFSGWSVHMNTIQGKHLCFGRKNK